MKSLMNFNNQKTQQEKIHYFHPVNQDSIKVDLIKALIQMQLKIMNMSKKRNDLLKNIDFYS
jgi:hypothetical protein